MTNDMLSAAARRSLAAAMATEPRIQEAKERPAVVRERTIVQTMRLLAQHEREADARALTRE